MKYIYLIIILAITITVFLYFKKKPMKEHTIETPNLNIDKLPQENAYDFVVSETGSISINGAQLLFGGIAERDVNGKKEVNLQIDVDMKDFIFPKEGDTITLNDIKFHIVKFEKPEYPAIGRVFINKMKD